MLNHQNDFDKDAYSLEYVVEDDYDGRQGVDLLMRQQQANNAFDKISRLSQKPNGQSFGNSAGGQLIDQLSRKVKEEEENEDESMAKSLEVINEIKNEHDEMLVSLQSLPEDEFNRSRPSPHVKRTLF